MDEVLHGRALASLSAYPKELRQSAPKWQTRKYWPWLDAVAWVHSQSSAVAELLAVHRQFARTGLRFIPNDEQRARGLVKGWEAEPVSDRRAEAQCVIVFTELFGDDAKSRKFAIDSAGESLRRALADNHCKAIGVPASGGPPQPIDAIAWSKGYAFKRNQGLADTVLTSADDELWFSDMEIEGKSLIDHWPAQLGFAAPKRRKTKYDWPAFEAHALDRLRDEGGYNEEWIAARLVDEMAQWCGRWDKTPETSNIKTHIGRAYTAYLKSLA